jgi:glycyl-tRNA synthetase (class II)
MKSRLRSTGSRSRKKRVDIKEEAVNVKKEAIKIKKEEDFKVKEEVLEGERRTPKRQRKSRGPYAPSVLAPSRGLASILYWIRSLFPT